MPPIFAAIIGFDAENRVQNCKSRTVSTVFTDSCRQENNNTSKASFETQVFFARWLGAEFVLFSVSEKLPSSFRAFRKVFRTGRPPKSISHLPSKHLFSSAKGEPPHLATKRWGLVEGYDKAEKPDLWRMFNARSETLHTSPVFRSLVKSKRWPLRTRLILGANSLNTFNMHMCMYLSHGRGVPGA